MVNIHDAYRPTGFSRTYPNLMTQEGINIQEFWKKVRLYFPAFLVYCIEN